MHPKIEAAARGVLKELLAQLTEKQQSNFTKIWRTLLPDAATYQEVADQMPASKIDAAISLCERTIALNEEVNPSGANKKV